MLNSTSPEPVSEKDEVSSWDSSGKRNSSEQVLPSWEAGMSKLKIELTVPEAVPLKEVW